MNHTASKAWPILYPEDGGDIFLRNVGWISSDYMALHSRIHNSSLSVSSQVNYATHKLEYILYVDLKLAS
jgi:hypothetical protein